MKMHVAFEGGKELADQLAQLSPRTARRESLDALKAAAVPILAIARDYLPRSSGPGPHLEDNLGTSVESPKELAVALGPEKRPDYVFWGGFLEFGTFRTAARPWLRPAFQQGVWRSLEILKTWLWASMKKRAARVRKT